MSDLMIALCLGGLLCAVILYLCERYRRAHDVLSMQRMRGSSMYYDLYSMIEYARGRDLDEVRVERDRIIFFSMSPPGKLCEFRLSVGGYRYMNSRRVRALMQVLTIDLPQLQDNRNYRLRKYRVMRPNGVFDTAYAFTARSAYKAKLMGARQHITLDRLL